MKIVIKRPGEPAEAMDISDSLEKWQELVGGYIECVSLTPHMAMIVNEEGKIKNLPKNFPWRDDYIVGNALFVGIKDYDLADLDEGIVEALLAYWSEVGK
jgi:hypothetical protein